jgi:predicted site-specific integrase-resolvase
MKPLEQVVTASEWAKHCGVSVQYIRRLCVEGKLKARQTEEGVWLIQRPKPRT